MVIVRIRTSTPTASQQPYSYGPILCPRRGGSIKAQRLRFTPLICIPRRLLLEIHDDAPPLTASVRRGTAPAKVQHCAAAIRRRHHIHPLTVIDFTSGHQIGRCLRLNDSHSLIVRLEYFTDPPFQYGTGSQPSQRSSQLLSRSFACLHN